MFGRKCPHCGVKLGDFLYAEACPRCHEVLRRNRAKQPSARVKVATVNAWPAGVFLTVLRFVES